MPEVLQNERESALVRFHSTPSGREKPGRFWKIDIESLAPTAIVGGHVRYSAAPPRAIVCDLETAKREHPALVARALGKAADPAKKFVQLTSAYEGLGVFVYVPADCHIDEIVITYSTEPGESAFPHTVVLAERGARVSIVERTEPGSRAFVCSVAEIVTEESADVAYASLQLAPEDASVIATRAARPGRNAAVRWSTADLGAALALHDIGIALDEAGASAKIATLFFPGKTQHVDVVSTVDHRVGNATSETLVKSAANGAGQGRYLGTIRIAAHAQHSEASLRDDALLLSKRSHIDSVPALEIAANDVKAFHGATVGALDDEQIFYMSSRGVEPQEAERMIALGFFEPVIERFPVSLHEEIREALVAKVES